jgi:hypothetical protein
MPSRLSVFEGDMERLIDFGWNLGTALVTAVGAGVAWLIRRVLTNQAEIELLKGHIEARDEAITELRASVKRIETWIMEKAK